jgi:hypothetical protein
MQTELKIGDRIRLVSMTDDPDPIPTGALGTIVGVYPQRGWTQVDVNWDSGRSLMLTIPPDRIELVPVERKPT